MEDRFGSDIKNGTVVLWYKPFKDSDRARSPRQNKYNGVGVFGDVGRRPGDGHVDVGDDVHSGMVRICWPRPVGSRKAGISHLVLTRRMCSLCILWSATFVVFVCRNFLWFLHRISSET